MNPYSHIRQVVQAQVSAVDSSLTVEVDANPRHEPNCSRWEQKGSTWVNVRASDSLNNLRIRAFSEDCGVEFVCHVSARTMDPANIYHDGEVWAATVQRIVQRIAR